MVTRPQLRQILQAALPTPSDAWELIVDHFPEEQPHIPADASLQDLFTTLLLRVDSERLLSAISTKPEWRQRGKLESAAAEHRLVAAPGPAPLTAQPVELIEPKASYEPSWYVPRPAFERQLLATLTRPRGAAVVVQAPELLGKTWLLWHLTTLLRRQAAVAHLDLRTLPQEKLADKVTLLTEVAAALAAATGMDGEAMAASAFARPGGAEANLRFLLDRHVLPALGPGRALVLAIDGFEELVDRPYQDDVLGLLRGLLQANPGSPRDALRLLLAISTGPALSGHSIYQSSFFGISELQSLPDFRATEMAVLASRFGLQPEAVSSLAELVGCHPYLLHRGLYEARRHGQTPQWAVDNAAEVFAEYLEYRRRRLHQQEGLYEALRRIDGDRSAVIPFAVRCRLLDGGYLKLTADGGLVLRCPLYQRL